MNKLSIIATAAALLLGLPASAPASANTCVGGEPPDVDLVIDIEGGG